MFSTFVYFKKVTTYILPENWHVFYKYLNKEKAVTYDFNELHIFTSILTFYNDRQSYIGKEDHSYIVPLVKTVN